MATGAAGAPWRVRIALALKGATYEYQPVHLLKGEQHAEPFRTLNLLESVPVLEWHEGGAVRRLAQSLAIIDFLDQRFPRPRSCPPTRGSGPGRASSRRS
jgi:maleylpyruvate isomerase